MSTAWMLSEQSRCLPPDLRGCRSAFLRWGRPSWTQRRGCSCQSEHPTRYKNTCMDIYIHNRHTMKMKQMRHSFSELWIRHSLTTILICALWHNMFILRCSLSSCFACLYNRVSDNSFFLVSLFSLFCLFIYILKLPSTLSVCLCLVIQGTSGHSKCTDPLRTHRYKPTSLHSSPATTPNWYRLIVYPYVTVGRSLISVCCLEISKGNILFRIFTNHR